MGNFPFHAPGSRRGRFGGRVAKTQEPVFAIAVPVWLVTHNTAKVLLHANSVGAMRTIRFAFGTQHESRRLTTDSNPIPAKTATSVSPHLPRELAFLPATAHPQ